MGTPHSLDLLFTLSRCTPWHVYFSKASRSDTMTLGSVDVIDGKQRLHAVSNFLASKLRLGGLRVFTEINGLTFDEMEPELRTVLVTRPTVRAIIILRQSHPAIKYAVFERLNTGGVRLNAQEIRNSAFPGPLNDLVLELSGLPQFHALLGIRDKETSALYKTMRDCELVLRFFAFKDVWAKFAGGVAGTLTSYMDKNRHASATEISKLRNHFIDTLKTVEAAFGGHAFRRWNPAKKAWARIPLAAMYDAQMLACYGMERQLLARKRSRLISGIKALFSKDEFRDAVIGATNTPSSLKSRVSQVKDLLRRVAQ